MSTAFTAGVATITRAATLYWTTTPGSTTNPITDGAGTWGAGASFYNPLTFTDVALGTSADTTDTAVFGNGGYLGSPAIVNLSQSQTVGGLVFGVTGLNGYTLASSNNSTLTIGTSGLTMNAGAQNSTLASNLAVALGGSETWANNSGGSLNVGGGISGGGSALALNAASTGNITISGESGGRQHLHGRHHPPIGRRDADRLGQFQQRAHARRRDLELSTRHGGQRPDL